MNSSEDDSLRQPASAPADWLVAFKTACRNLDVESDRRMRIPTLGSVVKQKSDVQIKSFWSRNRSKPDGEREPFPKVTDIAEQREIEQIAEAWAAAQTQVVILRERLPRLLPLGVRGTAESLLSELREHGLTASNEDLIRLVEELVESLRRQTATKGEKGRPAKIPSSRKASARARKEAGATNRECAQILYDTPHPTNQQVKNVSTILRHYDKTLKSQG
jgi:hypothetical protein